MSSMTGVVEAESTKDVTTKWGVKPTYSIKVNGTWVKCGFKKPPCNTGDEISFDGETGTYGLEGKNIIVTAKGSGAPPASSTAVSVVPSSKGASTFNARVFPIPPLHGDRSIVRQNALARSTELFIGCRGGKPFDLNEDATKIIISIARQFEAYTAGDLDLAQAEAETVEEKAAV